MSILWSAAVFAAEPAAKGLAVHEWGVFTAHDDLDVANAESGPSGTRLPEFVYGRIKGRVLPVNWGPRRVPPRPLIFFHSQNAVDLRVRVGFPGRPAGRVVAGDADAAAAEQMCQPAATDYPGMEAGRPPAPGRLPGAPASDRRSPRATGSRPPRAVKCEEVFAVYGEQQFGLRAREVRLLRRHLPAGQVGARSRSARTDVALLNRTKHPVFDVTVVDRRTAGQVRVGRDRPARRRRGGQGRRDGRGRRRPVSSPAASATLLKQLTAAGLNADEAGLLVAVPQGATSSPPTACRCSTASRRRSTSGCCR